MESAQFLPQNVEMDNNLSAQFRMNANSRLLKMAGRGGGQAGRSVGGGGGGRNYVPRPDDNDDDDTTRPLH